MKRKSETQKILAVRDYHKGKKNSHHFPPVKLTTLSVCDIFQYYRRRWHIFSNPFSFQ